MKNNDSFRPKRNDFILIGILAAAAAVLAVILLFAKGNESGNLAQVILNGKTYGLYDLEEDKTLRIETDLGYNIVEIRSGCVSVIEADCPDRYCVSKGAVSQPADPIVCLPHRLVIQILTDRPETISYDVISE